MSLTLININKTYKSKKKSLTIIDNLNFSIPNGQFVCILGPSGCGKSTLLNILAGIDQSYEGQVILDDEVIIMANRNISMVFQESALFPWLNVIHNVEFGLHMNNVSKEIRQEAALKYLKMVGLDNFIEARVHQLSGGMKQRVSIARALALETKVLLMDEPFSALDVNTREDLQSQLRDIWKKTNKTIIFVTHSITEAIALGERIIIMQGSKQHIDLKNESYGNKKMEADLFQKISGYFSRGATDVEF